MDDLETRGGLGLIAVHLRAILIELWRTPGFLVPTLLFPSMLYLFFGGPSDAPDAPFRLAAFAVYGVMGVTFYQFGVGLAEDREKHWSTYLRVLPVTLAERFAARIAAGVVVSVLTVVVLAVVAAVTGVGLAAEQWVMLAAALAFGAVPFGFFGVALGYLLSARAAVPVANLIFLPLAYGGAVWMPPDRLPDAVAALSPVLPSRQFAEIAWAAVAGALPGAGAVFGLTAYGAVFIGLCVWAFRRDSRARR